MITTAQIVTDLKTALEADWPNVTWIADSEEPDVPGPAVWVAPVPGPSEEVDGLVVVRAFDIDVAGKQMDFDYAERLAMAVDAHVVGDGGSTVIAGTRVIARYRAGGLPYMSQRDDADRTHFVCGYLHEVGYGG